MAFKDIRFPTGISFGAVGGPGYSTDIVSMNSGHESRNQNWSVARCLYDAAKGCNTDQDRIDLITFFRVVKGRAHSFRWKDWTDFEVLTGEGVMVALGGNTYQLYKRYTNSAGTEDREIKLPRAALATEEDGTAIIIKQGSTILRSGIEYTLDLLTGILTVIGSPTTFPDSWLGQFDVPARFDTDMLRLVAEEIEYFKSQSIPIVEVRDLDD